jgi:hypothetical protein
MMNALMVNTFGVALICMISTSVWLKKEFITTPQFQELKVYPLFQD